MSCLYPKGIYAQQTLRHLKKYEYVDKIHRMLLTTPNAFLHTILTTPDLTNVIQIDVDKCRHLERIT